MTELRFPIGKTVGARIVEGMSGNQYILFDIADMEPTPPGVDQIMGAANFAEPPAEFRPADDYPTEAARDIMERLLQEWVDKFLEKNGDYGETYKTLGSRGQFAEIWRKVPKLKRAMWDGVRLSGEQPREILSDLIGHCFMAIHLLDESEAEK